MNFIRAAAGVTGADRPTSAPLPVAESKYGALQKAYRTHGRGSVNAFDLHKDVISNYQKIYCGKASQAMKMAGSSSSDLELLRGGHRFVWDEADESSVADTWVKRMCLKYYNRLFKEYALADLSKYREGKIGFRWRTEHEVVSGKGQFSCGNKICDSLDGLHSYEVNFSYVESGVARNALVKVRMCAHCALKLFYRKIQAFKKARRKINSGTVDDGDQYGGRPAKKRELEGSGSFVTTFDIPDELDYNSAADFDSVLVHENLALLSGQRRRDVTCRDDNVTSINERVSVACLPAFKKSKWEVAPENVTLESSAIRTTDTSLPSPAVNGESGARLARAELAEGEMMIRGDEWSAVAPSQSSRKDVDRSREEDLEEYLNKLFY